MAGTGVKWKHLERFCHRTPGYTIRPQGGDKLIVGPNGGVVVIGHHFCGHAGDELRPGHLSALRRRFGITAEDIRNA